MRDVNTFYEQIYIAVEVENRGKWRFRRNSRAANYFNIKYLLKRVYVAREMENIPRAKIR